ncbi:MAG: hypothetical protein GY904_04560 [Planctomycetaceae bacterium]|nr:hypothetical protein [Planctomycetaceae bacterium]
MTLQTIDIPDSINRLPYAKGAEHLIDTANDAIEAFMLADQTVIENFVTCDFHLLDQAITWIEQSHLLAGNRFCEFGAGFGVGAMLAALRGMESVGIEIEPRLVEQANQVAAGLGNAADFYCGSFVPRGVEGLAEIAAEVENVSTEEDDIYESIGRELNEFDLFFAFPWPGEHGFFEAVFEACAAKGALLLTYRGREGMNLVTNA